MADMEKVIEALETCRDQDNPPGYRFTSCKSDCPYHGNGCARKLKEDAIALLKEQEAKEQISDAIHETAKQFRQTIVRCKDCKHGQNEEWDNGECVDKTVYCDGYGIHKPDWFCADGERKDSN